MLADRISRIYETVLLASSRYRGWFQERLFHGMGRWVPFLSEDAFISYSRADGSRYAIGLAAELARHKLNCVTDVFAAEVGRQIPPNLSRALRRARQLVVLATEGAIRSEGVAWEVEHFPSEGRSVVIIGFGDAAKQAPWFLPGFDPQQESSDRLASGEPSPDIVRTILQAYKFKTQRQRLTRLAVGVVALVVAGVGATGALWFIAQDARQETTRVLGDLKQARAQLTETETEVTAARRTLAETNQQLRLVDARRTALDVDVIRRAEEGYTPPGDVVRALIAARDLGELGAPSEAEALLRESVNLLPRLVATFRVPQGRAVLAGEPPRLFVATGDKVVRVWDPSQGNEVKLTSSLVTASAIQKLEAAGGGKWLLVTTVSEVSLWNPAALTSTPVARESCRRGGRASASAVSPDGSLLAMGCGPVVQLTDLSSNPPAPMFVSWQSRAGGFDPVALYLNEHLLIVVGARESSVFTLKGGEAHRLKDDMCAPGMLLGVSADASAIVRDASPRVEGPEKDYRVCRTRGIRHDDVFEADVLDRDYVALRAPRRDAEEKGVWREVLRRGPVFSGDGKYIAIPSVANVRVFESSSGNVVGVVHARPDASSLGVSFNGDLIVLATPEGEVQTWETQPLSPGVLTDSSDDRIWLTATGAVLGEVDHDGIRRVTESEFPHGPRRVTCERQAETLRCDRQGSPWGGLVLVDLAYRPAFGWVGLELAAGEYRASRLEPRAEICHWKADGEYELSADGSLAISTDGQSRVLDLTRRCQPRPITKRIETREIEKVMATPDGPILAVRSNSCMIRLVKLETGDPIANIDECVRELDLSRDGRFLAASGASDVSVWDLRSGKRIAKRGDVHGDPSTRSISMSPDQRHVLVREAARITVWRWQWDDIHQEVCRVLKRNVDADQWQKRVPSNELAKACATVPAPINPAGR